MKEKIAFENIKPLQDALKASQEKLKDRGRIIIRYSGTEPLARVMVEADNIKMVNEICNELVAIIKKEIG